MARYPLPFCLKAMVVASSFLCVMSCSKTSSSTKTNGSKTGSSKSTSPPKLRKNKAGDVIVAEFYQTNITSAAIAEMKKHKAIQEIVFVECKNFDKQTIDELSELKTLELLSFTRSELHDDEIQSLATLPRLRELWLSHTKLTAKGITALKECKSLKLLVLNKGFDPADLTPFPELPQITTLELDLNGFRLGKMRGFEQFTSLEILKIPNLTTEDSDLKDCIKLQNLKSLIFTAAEVSDSGAKHLTEFSNLEEISLTRSKITEKTVASLSTMKMLKTLVLDECKGVTNDGLIHLAQAPKLERLSIVGAGVTGEGLKNLATSKTLKYILIATEVTKPAHVAALKVSLPNCTVELVKTKF